MRPETGKLAVELRSKIELLRHEMELLRRDMNAGFERDETALKIHVLERHQ